MTSKGCPFVVVGVRDHMLDLLEVLTGIDMGA
jgi:hypothetical protein